MKYISFFLFSLIIVYCTCMVEKSYAVDPDKKWVSECMDSAEQRLRNYEKGVKKVKIDESTLEKTKSTNSIKVLRGSGKFITYSGGWKDFTFNCKYDKEDKEVAKVSYDVKGYSGDYTDDNYYGGGNYSERGECKLWDKKEDYLDMEGTCRVERRKSGRGSEYTVTFNNGKEFRFYPQGSSYKVKMPKEWASNPGYISDYGGKMTFTWAKWKLVFKEY